MHACVLSCFGHVLLFATLWTVARQAPLSMGFSRQEYWGGLPCPFPNNSVRQVPVFIDEETEPKWLMTCPRQRSLCQNWQAGGTKESDGNI